MNIKRLLAVIMVLVCLSSSAVAVETGLEHLTYEELQILQRLTSLEAMSRPEWKETTVPSGTWTVGVDIPAGTYSIFPKGTGAYIRIKRSGNLLISQPIRKEEDAFWRIDLADGNTVEVQSGMLIFAPPKGLDF